MSSRAPSIVTRLAAHALVYVVAASMLLPFLWMVSTALKTDLQALPREAAGESVTFLPPGWPWEWRWGNFADAARAVSLWDFYQNSLVAAALTTLVAGVHNALAGFALAKFRFKGERAVFWLVMSTMMLPVQVSFIFAYIAAGRLGMVDNIQALVVPFAVSGFGIYSMRQAIATVPDSLLEAGRLDGMSDLELFWHVVRPIAWPTIAALGIFTFVASWNSFFWPLVVVDSVHSKTLPLAVAELSAGRYVQSWPVRMAAMTILTLPLIVVFVVFQRAFVRGVAMAAVKE